MTNSYNLFDGIDDAQDVGNLGDAHQPRARRQQARQQVQAEVSGIVHGQHLQRGALAPAKQLPGHDVGVVLRFADDDLVTGAHEGFAEAVRDEVDGGRGARGEDDFLAEFSVQPGPDGIPRVLVFRGRDGRRPVDRTVEIGVVFLGHLRPLADDAAGPFGRSRIVQIDKRFAVNGLREGGEFLTYIFEFHHKEMQK